MIRVLIADDSPTSRALLSGILADDGRFAVVSEAVDGLDAVKLANSLKPDVIVMDIHMPVLDGVEATRRIMEEHPTPIVMVTGSSNHDHIKVVLNAMDAGALAVLHKPQGPSSPEFEAEKLRITATVAAMAGVTSMRRHLRDPEGWNQLEEALSRRTYRVRAVGIAASTGGPGAVRRILSELPVPFPVPILIVQHIADGFGAGLAEWLREGTTLTVKMAAAGDMLQDGTVYVAPDQRHMGVSRELGILLSDADPIEGARPSATFLFDSLARVYGASALGIILTGMGRDGVAGLRTLKAAGGLILAQDERSSVVFGMPGSAIAEGLASAVVPLEAMALQIGRAVRRG